MVPYATLRLRLFPHLRWGFANYSIRTIKESISSFIANLNLIVYSEGANQTDPFQCKNDVHS